MSQVTVTLRVRTEAERQFTAERAAAVCAELATVDLPLIANNGERVHLAVLKLSGGDIAAFRRHLALARLDWRDTLVAAGL